MTKKDEINKNNNIIIGIATFAIIAIAIIVAFNFFIPKSHAQVQAQDFEKVAVYTRNKVNAELHKGFVDKQNSVKNEKRDVFKTAHFVNAFDKVAHKNKTEYSANVFKADDKNAFTFAFAKVKGSKEFPQAKSFVKDYNFKDNFSFEKETMS